MDSMLPESPIDPLHLAIEVSGDRYLGPCPDCGTSTRRVWGYVRHSGEPLAAYFVEWTLGRPDHGAYFDLVIGRWGEGSSSADRWAASLEYRVVDGNPGFMVLDAGPRPVASSDLARVALARADLVETPLAATVFAIADTVFAGDPRIDEIRNWG